MHERKHQMIMAAVQFIDSGMHAYERSCLEIVLTKTLMQQRHFALSMLEPPVKAHPGLSFHLGCPVDVARSMRCDGVHYTVSALVIGDDACGLVKVFLHTYLNNVTNLLSFEQHVWACAAKRQWKIITQKR